ncbi:MAG: single-stranded DNA-binding protein [Syntrophorhabdus sp.]
MLNNIFLHGNLGNDPEVFYSSEGNPVASFSLAFHSGKDKTSWIKVTAFKGLAEIVEANLKKGNRVVVSGSLDQEKWQAQDGTPRSTFKVIAHSIEFFHNKAPQDQDFIEEKPE